MGDRTLTRARVRGTAALSLGVVGSLLAIAALIASILFVIGANAIVDGIEERITQPIQRVERGISDTALALASVDEGELNVRLQSLADQAVSAEAGLDAITEHPLYRRVPVDFDELEERVTTVAEQAEDLSQQQFSALSDADRERIGERLEQIAAPLDGVDRVVRNAADSLRFWIRLSGVLFIVLSLWGLWAQLVLAREGRRWWSTRSVDAAGRSTWSVSG